MNKAAGVAGCDVNSGVEMGFLGIFVLMLSELQTRGPKEQKTPSKPKKRKKQFIKQQTTKDIERQTDCTSLKGVFLCDNCSG